jgi:alpha-L-fucosidase
MKRIQILSAVVFVCLGTALFAQIDNLPVADGKFKPTDESLQTYQYPDWFRDAKFGIWSVWGPIAVPRAGDWYAKEMYNEKSSDYKHHLKHYGHPSVAGYKDLIPLWKAEKWNPEELMKLYKKTGAKYFCSIASHHDNFFLWDSKLHEWNAVKMGPKRDVIGLWQQAAKKEGLYFGVTEHLGASYTWFQAAHGSDKEGDKAGIPYDGANFPYWGLYHRPTKAGDDGWLTNDPEFQREWYDRIKELIDNYHPDLLYSDSAMPFGNVGRSLITHYYNQAAEFNKNGVVYNCKEKSDGRWVQDYERGVAEGINEHPWQIDTSIGDWTYRDNDNYKSGTEIVQMLVDVVSKNGNLLLCVPPTPEGTLDEAETKALNDIGDWMAINGEAIYGTRPWKIYGDGPSVTEKQEKGPFQHLKDSIKDFRKYVPSDLRFTQKGKTLYIFSMEKPDGDIAVKPLGLKSATGEKVSSVKLLGSDEKVEWSQNDEAVIIKLLKTLPDKPVVFAAER